MAHRKLHFSRYRHYKGNVYVVLALARHSETGEELVVYRQEVGPRWGMIWARPKDMFLEDTVVVDGEIVPRFKYIGF